MTRMFTLGVLALVVLVCVVSIARPAAAAIVYEPVQYQYGSQARYYYGGSDASVHHFANRFIDKRIIRDAEGQLSNLPARVFADSLPRLNASLYGLTANDAKNQAYASIPRYFRKVDLVKGSHIDCSGNLIVPATAPQATDCGTIQIKPWKGYPAVVTPKPVLIVPKSQLNLDAPLNPPQGEPSKA